MSLEALDQRLKESEVKARKRFLVGELKKLGIEQSVDGRRLEDLSLYSLEWMHAEEQNKAAKAFGEG